MHTLRLRHSFAVDKLGLREIVKACKLVFEFPLFSHFRPIETFPCRCAAGYRSALFVYVNIGTTRALLFVTFLLDSGLTDKAAISIVIGLDCVAVATVDCDQEIRYGTALVMVHSACVTSALLPITGLRHAK